MSHTSRWALRDAGTDSRIYECLFCDATREVRHPGGVGADRVRLPQEVHNPEPAPWSLPHMEQTPPPPSRAMLLGELERAEAEFGNAMAMHRSAWVKARQRRDELAEEIQRRYPGDVRRMGAELGALCETDPKYIRRIGDVKFWAGERQALAASVSALAAMVGLRPPPFQMHMNPPVPRQR